MELLVDPEQLVSRDGRDLLEREVAQARLSVIQEQLVPQV